MLFAFIFLYAFLAMFVVTSIDRNRRQQRSNTSVLTMHGYGLMAGSFTMAALLFAYSAFLYIRG